VIQVTVYTPAAFFVPLSAKTAAPIILEGKLPELHGLIAEGAAHRIRGVIL
jgi:hypothetical protein